MSRIEEKQEKKLNRKRRNKEFFVILTCFIFFISMIYIIDITTSELLNKKDDKYAIYANVEKEGLVRLDIAGNTIKLYIKPFLDIVYNIYHKINSFISSKINVAIFVQPSVN